MQRAPLYQIYQVTRTHTHKDSLIQIVGFVLGIHAIIETGDRKYLLRATLSDVNGQRCYLSWFLDCSRADKTVGILKRVSGKPVWALALESLHKVALRAMIFNSVRVVETEKKYKNPMNVNIVMDHNTLMHELTEANGDYSKMKPLVGAWGIPSDPLATVTADLESMSSGEKYFPRIF